MRFSGLAGTVHCKHVGAILRKLVRRGEIPEHIREALHRSKGEFGGQGSRSRI